MASTSEVEAGKQRWRTAFKAWRTLKDINQAQAAELLGVRKSAVCQWESGKRTPQREMRDRIQKKTRGAVRARLVPPNWE